MFKQILLRILDLWVNLSKMKRFLCYFRVGVPDKFRKAKINITNTSRKRTALFEAFILEKRRLVFEYLHVFLLHSIKTKRDVFLFKKKKNVLFTY